MKPLFVRTLAITAAFAVGALLQTGVSSLAQNAPSPEALQAAQELASLTSVSVIGQTTSMLNNQVWPTVEAALRSKNPTIDAATLADLRREYEDLQTKATIDALAATAPIYSRYFTAEELRQLITFYRTPLGAKMLATMPRVSVEILQAMIPRMQNLPQIVNERFSAILQQKGYRQ